MSEAEPTLTFDESATEYVLDVFGKEVNEEGLIVEADTGEPVLAPDGTEIMADELGGIGKGSEIFIKDNFVSILKYVQRKQA